ncbi:MAG: hypothetical protein RR320_02425, partial [Oscillospiraceae bacterium]
MYSCCFKSTSNKVPLEALTAIFAPPQRFLLRLHRGNVCKNAVVIAAVLLLHQIPVVDYPDDGAVLLSDSIRNTVGAADRDLRPMAVKRGLAILLQNHV